MKQLGVRGNSSTYNTSMKKNRENIKLNEADLGKPMIMSAHKVSKVRNLDTKKGSFIGKGSCYAKPALNKPVATP